MEKNLSKSGQEIMRNDTCPYFVKILYISWVCAIRYRLRESLRLAVARHLPLTREALDWCDFLSLITEENQGVQPKIFGVRQICLHKLYHVNGEAAKPAGASPQTLIYQQATQKGAVK